MKEPKGLPGGQKEVVNQPPTPRLLAVKGLPKQWTLTFSIAYVRLSIGVGTNRHWKQISSSMITGGTFAKSPTTTRAPQSILQARPSTNQAPMKRKPTTCTSGGPSTSAPKLKQHATKTNGRYYSAHSLGNLGAGFRVPDNLEYISESFSKGFERIENG